MWHGAYLPGCSTAVTSDFAPPVFLSIEVRDVPEVVKPQQSLEGGESHMLDLIMAYLRPYLKREEGQALVEYALILALIAVVSVGALTLLGQNVRDMLNSIAGSI
jgi:pilus assembly protein Flp/PilA